MLNIHFKDKNTELKIESDSPNDTQQIVRIIEKLIRQNKGSVLLEKVKENFITEAIKAFFYGLKNGFE